MGRWWLYLFCCLWVACGRSPGEANETEIGVAPEFADFYRAAGGLPVLGEPITEPFVAGEDGRLLQYFPSVRLEHESQAGSVPVLVYPLGEWAIAGLATLPPEPLDEQPIWSQFAAFYEAYNGAVLLGPPLSAGYEEDGQWVQYFRNGRLEWHPELLAGQQVQLTRLGQAHFNAEMVFTYRRALLAQPVSFAGLDEVDVYAAVQSPVLFAGDQQVLSVTVLTPEGRPVVGIPVRVVVQQGEARAIHELGHTNGAGQIVTSLLLDNVAPGRQVELTIVVYTSGDNLIGQAMVAFRTWW